MRRLTWFMRKHSEGKAHWDDEERPWNPFLLSDVRQDGTPFVFIVHHPSIVFQSVNGRRAVAICMLIISLAHMKHWQTTCSSAKQKPRKSARLGVFISFSLIVTFEGIFLTTGDLEPSDFPIKRKNLFNPILNSDICKFSAHQDQHDLLGLRGRKRNKGKKDYLCFFLNFSGSN